jgi:oligopeptidase B
VEGVYYGSAWAADNRSFFYIRPDEAMRPYQVWTHVLGEPVEADRLVFEEEDERFGVSVGLTRSERYVILHSGSKMTSETRWIDATRPRDEPAVVLARRQGVEYDVEHAVLGAGDVWLVRSNVAGPDGEIATNFSVTVLPLGATEPAEVFVGHRSDVKLESVDAFATHVVIAERAEGLERLRVISLPDRVEHVIVQPDPVYSLTGSANPEWQSTSYRFGYTSLVTPISTIEYDVATRERAVVKVQAVLGGYRADELRSERIWATAPDGTEVPVSLVCRRDQVLDGTAPCLLYGYGSYEIAIDPAFSVARLNLLERGFVYAIAHVRGGGEMGRRWYEQGRLEHKANTFTDFIACAEHLIASGYTSADRLVIRGGSAGGLLVGAVANLRPDLFAAVVAEVPFVDIVTTMSDETLPLTIGEWEEWGNPVVDAEAYRRMLSYSPYDNVHPAHYPAMYVTAGLNDPRVGYFEPAKWVAKLRATTTGDRPILLRTELGAGHQGQSGRYDAWRDEARVQAFVLVSVGITE